MQPPARRTLIISDFNVDIFAGYLNNDIQRPQFAAATVPFGQVISVLIQKELECWRGNYDVVVVWTKPESVIPSFKGMMAYQGTTVQSVLSEVDEYAEAVLSLHDRAKCVFVPAWTLSPYYRGYGILDMKKGIGITDLLTRMNLRLADKLESMSNIYMLNAQRWLTMAGENACNPKLWYLAKMPFANDVFKWATIDIKAALRGMEGETVKLVILDLDDTLWGGSVGEVGWEQLCLGGHSAVGEAFVDFQRGLKALTARGLLLSIVSKNTESVALEAINRHPEMVLALKDFAGWKINWRDKAENIVALTSELNLGLQSVLFIDDNPVERARVKEMLPEVIVPEWPENKMMYPSALLALPYFDTPMISAEDRERNTQYLAEHQRESIRREIGSYDEWLKTLSIKVRAEEFHEGNLERTVQLLNKTNQMNLSTRRMTAVELRQWLQGADRKLWTFRVSDKLGDSGLTGILSLEVSQNKGRIVDFVLSCRVLGRKIEETMLFTAISYARAMDLNKLEAYYLVTAKNQRCLEFLTLSGLTYEKEACRFSWNIEQEYPLPDAIELEWARQNSTETPFIPDCSTLVSEPASPISLEPPGA
jgi:FkbH-like protein